MMNFAIALLILALLLNIFLNKTITLESVLIFCAAVSVGVMAAGWNYKIQNITKPITLILIIVQIILLALTIYKNHH